MSRPQTWGIDGDIVCYSVGFAAEEDPVSFALHSAKVMCQDILFDCNEDGAEGIIYLTGSTNYREQEACEQYPYKGNRAQQTKPRHLNAIREYLVEHHGAIVSDNEEADDLLGIAAVQQGHGIATIDKDLLGVPGHHWNWKRKEYVLVSEAEADRFFYKQMLSGDATDNIPGIFKRVGMKATKKITAPLEEMTDPAEMYAHVRQAYLTGYEKVGIALDEAEEVVDRWLLQQARCLWIRRDAGQLWEAPSGA